MGQLYINNRAVTPIITKTKEVAKTKFGATVDSFLGNVDADGNYVAPSEPVEINLAGVKSVPKSGFFYGFVQAAVNVFNANDVEFIDFASFQNAFYANKLIQEAHFDGFEQVAPSSNNCFSSAFSGCLRLKKITFNKLKICNSSSAFSAIFGGADNPTLNISEVFPVLEEIKGVSAFNGFISPYNYATKNIPIEFPSLKIIEGNATSKYSSTFGSAAYTNLIYKFPNVTQITGYVWNSTAVFEIHFAAANQAAIEACEGYDEKWGATNATIYFDL